MFDDLPRELAVQCLSYCSAVHLGKLQASCVLYHDQSTIIDDTIKRIARTKYAPIPLPGRVSPKSLQYLEEVWSMVSHWHSRDDVMHLVTQLTQVKVQAFESGSVQMIDAMVASCATGVGRSLLVRDAVCDRVAGLMQQGMVSTSAATRSRFFPFLCARLDANETSNQQFGIGVGDIVPALEIIKRLVQVHLRDTILRGVTIPRLVNMLTRSPIISTLVLECLREAVLDAQHARLMVENNIVSMLHKLLLSNPVDDAPHKYGALLISELAVMIPTIRPALARPDMVERLLDMHVLTRHEIEQPSDVQSMELCVQRALICLCNHETLDVLLSSDGLLKLASPELLLVICKNGGTQSVVDVFADRGSFVAQRLTEMIDCDYRMSADMRTLTNIADLLVILVCRSSECKEQIMTITKSKFETIAGFACDTIEIYHHDAFISVCNLLTAIGPQVFTVEERRLLVVGVCNRTVRNDQQVSNRWIGACIRLVDTMTNNWLTYIYPSDVVWLFVRIVVRRLYHFLDVEEWHANADWNSTMEWVLDALRMINRVLDQASPRRMVEWHQSQNNIIARVLLFPGFLHVKQMRSASVAAVASLLTRMPELLTWTDPSGKCKYCAKDFLHAAVQQHQKDNDDPASSSLDKKTWTAVSAKLQRAVDTAARKHNGNNNNNNTTNKKRKHSMHQ